jgi:hypothetical protein
MADKKFTIVLKKSPDYRIYPVQNVYGGPVLDASGILMNVCVDHPALPNYVTHPVLEDGSTVDMATIEDQAQVGNAEREILCGLFISVQEAKKIVSWLTTHIERIERGNR